MTARFSPLALVRIDDALTLRVRAQDRLGELAVSALVAIGLGAGAYGAVFGIWRAPEQALFGALKLPIVLVGVALFTAASSAVLAPLLGARLAPKQSVVVALASLAVTASILGALAPAAMVFVMAAPTRGGADDVAVQQGLVLAHTLVIAIAGIAGVLALLHLVGRLIASRRVARRVALAWLGTQLLVGAQLSWLLRPFLGSPTRAVTFLSPDALEGGFFDEVLRLSDARFGALAPFVLGWLGLMAAFWIVVALSGGSVSVTPREAGLEVASSDAPRELVPWSRVVGASALGAHVLVRLARDEHLIDRTLDVPCRSLAAADALARAIEGTRTARPAGPYR